MPVKPDKQAMLDGVKAAYTQAKQNADAAAAAAEDVANAMKQLEDDEELALLRTDNKAAIKALTAEEAKNALNMLHPDTLDTAAAPMGNLKVMPTDILPYALCDLDWVNEMKNVTMVSWAEATIMLGKSTGMLEVMCRKDIVNLLNCLQT